MNTVDLTLEGLTAESAAEIVTYIVNTGINVNNALMVSVTASCPLPEDEPNKAFLSPVPEGYDTVLGYLAKNHAEALKFDLWDAEATQRDGFWCCHRAKERGLVVCKVPAPPVLKEGETPITTVNAYPLSLLAERFGGAV